MPKTSILVALAVAAAPFLASEAKAVAIAPVGTTDVTVDQAVVDFLTTAGIAPTPIFPASASGTTFSFPITGGDLDALLITHSGGLRLDDGASFIEVSDFVIDGGAETVAGTVSGSAYTDAFEATLFTLAEISLDGPITADLLVTGTLNGALGTTFAGGADLGLTGGTFGSASTAPAPVPVPAALPLLAAGLGLMGFLGARRRQA